MVCTVLCLCLCVRVCLSACLSASVCVSAFACVLKSLFARKYTSTTYPVSVVLPGGRCHHPMYGNLRGASRPMWLCRFQGSEVGDFAQVFGVTDVVGLADIEGLDLQGSECRGTGFGC